ncbi:MAG: DUF1800 domain-containing protein [Candidatus Kapabacteria bacterium]|jgi:uncharacterized protein (DUF1800 family)|nr:DUF1800 domain-containing protein [Candidatus Kapabacteria bacterium]
MNPQHTNKPGRLIPSTIALVCLLASASILLTSSAPQPAQHLAWQASYTFPYKKAGFTDRQAAAYLLDRFAFGARPGDVDALVQQGLERWFEEQLEGKLPENDLNTRLAALTPLTMSNEEIVKTYPNAGFVLREAVQDGVIGKDALNGEKNEATMEKPADDKGKGKQEYRAKLLEYAKSKGYRQKKELYGAMYAQKLFRAVSSPNQLREVLTDFWFNHFNVSITDNQADQFVMSFERDAIRPNVVGSFRALLGATAKHPAMQAYLDNAQSSAPDGTPTTMSLALDTMRNAPGMKGAIQRRLIDSGMAKTARLRDSLVEKLPSELQPRKGINENYARELMELHTLGVDGGYTQKDVTEAARVLTGWTHIPMGQRANRLMERLQERPERTKALGYVREGDFLFRADSHDATAKTVMGTVFPASGGKEEGEQLLDMLAKHPSTAKFICTKIARRFVSDTPPEQLVSRMAAEFSASNGNIAHVLRTLAQSEEFWNGGKETLAAIPQTPQETSPKAKSFQSSKTKQPSPKAQATKPQAPSNQVTKQTSNQAPSNQTTNRTKIKSPFELAVSALRAMNAEIVRPREVLEWIRNIGQPLYAYQAPTGFPDRADAWINTGALLGRMNFGLNLALGSIAGVKFDLAALNHNHEPQSLDDALETYARLLMPERNVQETVRLLKPVLADPAFAEKVSAEALKNGKTSAPTLTRPNERKMPREEDSMRDLDDAIHEGAAKPETPPVGIKGSALAQVVGIILGSPEFQRR